jgi:hypothetical protein
MQLFGEPSGLVAIASVPSGKEYWSGSQLLR